MTYVQSFYHHLQELRFCKFIYRNIFFCQGILTPIVIFPPILLPPGPLIDSIAGVPEEFRHVVWTQSMRRLAVLVGRALRFGESVLLVGDTG